MEAQAGVMYAPFSRFVRSVHNVRKKTSSPEGLQELAALILSSGGLLQNLICHEERKGKKNTGKLAVCGGGRRLQALALLHADKKIADDYPVPYKLVSEESAVETSLAENSGREEMHPADEFEGMQALVNAGKNNEEIAVKFGVTPNMVTRRLKLANVSPVLFELFREDVIALDQMMAFAITDDHAAQESVWKTQPKHSRSANEIRRALTKNEVLFSSSPCAKFVGIAAYEKNGGLIRRDLFSETEDGYFQNVPLLEEMALTKLEKKANEIKKEGWAWVDFKISFDWDARRQFQEMRSIRAEMTPEQEATHAALIKEYQDCEEEQSVCADTGEGDEDVLLEKMDEIENRINEFEKSLEIPHPDDKAIAGALVHIGNNGKLEVLRGKIRPEDKRTQQKQSGEVEEKPKAIHSERLIKQLTAHRTAALQATLAKRPDVALAVLAEQLVYRAFSRYFKNVGLADINVSAPNLSSFAPDLSVFPASQALEAIHQSWAERMPKQDSGVSLFDWILTLSHDDVVSLISYCTALSLNAVRYQEEVHRGANTVAAALKLDVTEFWNATSDSYFAHVSRKRIIDVVGQAVSPEKAKQLDGMTKRDAAKAAENAMAGVRWVPELMRISE